MTLPDFIAKYNGQGNVGNTAENKGQCVGLVMVWLVDTLGNPHIWGHAKDLMANADRNAYEVITNTPDGVPQAGDVICWNGRMGGGYGHTAIVTKADVNTFEVFEQNTNPLTCHLHTYPSYSNVQGWIRSKKNQVMAVISQDELDAIRNRRDELYNQLQEETAKNNELKTNLENEQKKSQELREANDKLTKADADTGAELLDVSHERDNYKSTLEAWANALGSTIDLKSGLEAIEGLRRPIEEQVKPLQKHALSLQEELLEYAYKRVPQSKGWIERIKKFFKL